jgi:large subunit ribosomal protein L29
MASKEYKDLSEQELLERIREEKAGLNKMTLNHAISPVENPLKIRSSRRNIARLLTEVTKRKQASKK